MNDFNPARFKPESPKSSSRSLEEQRDTVEAYDPYTHDEDPAIWNNPEEARYLKFVEQNQPEAAFEAAMADRASHDAEAANDHKFELEQRVLSEPKLRRMYSMAQAINELRANIATDPTAEFIIADKESKLAELMDAYTTDATSDAELEALSFIIDQTDTTSEVTATSVDTDVTAPDAPDNQDTDAEVELPQEAEAPEVSANEKVTSFTDEQLRNFAANAVNGRSKGEALKLYEKWYNDIEDIAQKQKWSDDKLEAALATFDAEFMKARKEADEADTTESDDDKDQESKKTDDASEAENEAEPTDPEATEPAAVEQGSDDKEAALKELADSIIADMQAATSLTQLKLVFTSRSDEYTTFGASNEIDHTIIDDGRELIRAEFRKLAASLEAQNDVDEAEPAPQPAPAAAEADADAPTSGNQTGNGEPTNDEIAAEAAQAQKEQRGFSKDSYIAIAYAQSTDVGRQEMRERIQRNLEKAENEQDVDTVEEIRQELAKLDQIDADHPPFIVQPDPAESTNEPVPASDNYHQVPADAQTGTPGVVSWDDARDTFTRTMSAEAADTEAARQAKKDAKKRTKNEQNGDQPTETDRALSELWRLAKEKVAAVIDSPFMTARSSASNGERQSGTPPTERPKRIGRAARFASWLGISTDSNRATRPQSGGRREG